MTRVCDECRRPLAGPKGHGFVSDDGKTIKCSVCEYPPRKKTTRRRKSSPVVKS
jgi:hypothetical protein